MGILKTLGGFGLAAGGILGAPFSGGASLIGTKAGLALALGGAAASAIGGALDQRKKKITTTPGFTPEQLGIQRALGANLQERMNKPGARLAPLKTSAIESINRRYSSLPDTITERLASRGYGSSGKLARSLSAAEIQRLMELNELEAKFAGLELDEESRITDQGLRFAFQSPSQTQELPGNVAGGAIGAGGETLTYLFLLDRLLKGGGGAGSVPVPSGDTGIKSRSELPPWYDWTAGGSWGR